MSESVKALACVWLEMEGCGSLAWYQTHPREEPELWGDSGSGVPDTGDWAERETIIQASRRGGPSVGILQGSEGRGGGLRGWRSACTEVLAAGRPRREKEAGRQGKGVPGRSLHRPPQRGVRVSAGGPTRNPDHRLAALGFGKLCLRLPSRAVLAAAKC